jgi:hypothetical protein
MSTVKLKALNPKSPDTKYTGFEPEFGSLSAADRRSAIMRAFAWYNYHYDKKTAKQCVLDWLLQHDSANHRAFARVPDNAVPYQLGWLCRMNQRGLELTESEMQYVTETVQQHLVAAAATKRVVEVIEPATPQITIQDRLRAKAEEVAGELEGLYDDVLRNGGKSTADHKPMAIVRGMNLPPQMTGMIRDIWQHRLQELVTVQQGRDSALVEGYANFTKLQIRSLIKFTEQILADIASYVQIRRVEKRPRKVKAVSPEHRARRFRHLTQHDDPKLEGLPAARLVNSSEAWLYDVKKRKLIHLVADSHIGTITVKNNMLVGFGESDTQQKTLRKPAETILAMMAASKPNARKLFKDIKTTETAWNGRGTDTLMILRVW